MSDIAKCPVCGGKPLDKWEVTSVRVFQTGQMCCGVDCNTNERWDQYAAAMELAKAEVKLLDSIQAYAGYDQALIDRTKARERVLEVFK